MTAAPLPFDVCYSDGLYAAAQSPVFWLLIIAVVLAWETVRWLGRHTLPAFAAWIHWLYWRSAYRHRRTNRRSS